MLDEYICRLVSHGNGVYEYEPTGTELVRCRDCKYWRYDDCQNDSHGYCPTNENDYCSRGERKESEE